MADPPITHAPKMFKGFNLTKIEDLRLLHEALERKFVKIERYPDESDLKPEQIESLDKLWDCISERSEDAELAKEFMRMIIAAPTLVTEENRKSMTKRDLGLAIVGAALHRGGLGAELPAGESTKALETSFRSEVGCSDGRGKTYIGGGLGNPGSTEESTWVDATTFDPTGRFTREFTDSPPPTKKGSKRLLKPRSIRAPARSKASTISTSSRRNRTKKGLIAKSSKSHPASSDSEVSHSTDSTNSDDKKAPPKRRRTYRSPTQPKTSKRQQQQPPQVDRPVDEGVDKSLARHHIWDMEKLAFEYKTVRDDPENPGCEIPGETVRILYPRAGEVDFDKARTVERLNTWRAARVKEFEGKLRACGGKKGKGGFEKVRGEKEDVVGDTDEEEDVVVPRTATKRRPQRRVMGGDEGVKEEEEEEDDEGKTNPMVVTGEFPLKTRDTSDLLYSAEAFRFDGDDYSEPGEN